MVYVTHQIEFLPAADLILVRISLAHVSCQFYCHKLFASPSKVILMQVMNGERIAQAGKYNDIHSSGADLAELVGPHQDALTTMDVTDVANGGDEFEPIQVIVIR